MRDQPQWRNTLRRISVWSGRGSFLTRRMRDQRGAILALYIDTKTHICGGHSVSTNIIPKAARSRSKAASVFAALVTITALAGPAVASISGNVFQDFNSNGVRDTALTIANAGTTGGSVGAAVDVGLTGVNVTVRCVTGLGADGVLGTADDVYTTYPTVVTDSNGDYTVNVPGAVAGVGSKKACRVSFSWNSASALNGLVPNVLFGMRPSFAGSGSNTATQFVNDTESANLGLNYPADFCQNNPDLATTCLLYGKSDDVANSANQHALTSMPYSAKSVPANQRGPTDPSETSPNASTTMAKISEVGATWGLAYHKGSKTLLASAFIKRHSGIGPSGPGAIYRSTGSTGSLFVDLNALSGGAAAGADPRAAYTTTNDFDADAAIQVAGEIMVGKLGLGDLDLSDDGTTLYSVGLASKKLYVMNVGTGSTLAVPSTATAVNLPVPAPGATGCPTASDVRPFALKYYKGMLYVGLTCTAESTQLDTDMRAFVYRYDGTSFVQVLNESLNGAKMDGKAWHPWSNAGDATTSERPEPWLTDIEFSGNDMILGMRDRFGDVTSYNLLRLGSASSRVDGRGHGQMYKACLDAATGNYGTATCPTSGFNFFETQGPAAIGVEDPNGPNAGLVQVPGFVQIVSSVKDPAQWYSNGLAWFNNSDGKVNKGYEIYPSTTGASQTLFMGKASGLGDVEALCDAAPLEIGNRVWLDGNRNGVQDPGEAPIAGVTINLYNAANTVIASAVTDANGNYYFNNRTSDENGNALTQTNGGATVNAIAGLTPNTVGFKICADNSANYGAGNPLAKLGLSPANAGGDSSNSSLTDLNDSDATLPTPAAAIGAGNFPCITFATGAQGDNNFGLDIGFTPPIYALGNRIWFDTNNNGVMDAGEQPIPGVLVELLNSAGNPTGATTTTNASGYYLFDGLDAGTYSVRVAATNWSSVSGALRGYASSGTTVATNAAGDNSKDHGIDPANAAAYTTAGVVSNPVQLGGVGGAEIAGEDAGSPASTAGDANDNLTVDFGFYRLTAGNLVWSDTGAGANRNNGVLDAGETGIGGVIVQLVNSGGTVIAETSTNLSGNYSFTQQTAGGGSSGTDGAPILPGNYTVRIPASQAVLAGTFSSADPAGGGQPIGDSRDNGTGVAASTAVTNSATITLTAVGGLPAGATQTNANGTTDQPRMDFGFVLPIYALGNRIWFDTNNNGVLDAGELPIDGVAVELLNAANTVIGSTTTAGGGYYLFDNLPAGTYKVRVAASNWSSVSGVLRGYSSSGTTVATNAAADNNKDHGIDPVNAAAYTTSGVVSNAVQLGGVGGAEISGEDAAGPASAAGDANDNRTVDFGFYRLTLGNLVWNDNGAGGGTFNDGIVNGSEAGINGVVVQLVDGGGAVIAETTTAGGGLYSFTQQTSGGGSSGTAGAPILAGSYTVRIPASQAPLAGMNSSADPAGGGQPVGDSRDNGSGTAASTTVTNSPAVALAASGVLPAGATQTNATATTDQPRMDFGFYQPTYSLGNRVWFDTNNNGVLDAGELPITGVKVQLTDAGGTPVAGQTVVTDASGYYRFDGLVAGTYKALVTADNWTGIIGNPATGLVTGAVSGAAGSKPLAGYGNSTGVTGSATTNNNDKGVDPANAAAYLSAGVSSGVVTVGPGAQPSGDADTPSTPASLVGPTGDAGDNLTVDFGFYRLTVGNQIWVDVNGNTTFESGTDTTPVAVQGITVELRDSATNAVIASTTTSASGVYTFTSATNGAPILPGTYYVSLPALPPGYGPISLGTALTDNNNQGQRPTPAIVGVADRTGPFTLVPGAASGGQVVTTATGTTAQPTLDMGLQPLFSVGNRVWVDADNNGLVNGAEAGLDAVPVALLDSTGAQLYRTPAGLVTNVATGNTAITTTTASGGYYLFKDLPAGNYLIEIDPPVDPAKQVRYVSSTGTNASLTGPYEVGSSSFTAADTDKDHGTQQATGKIRSTLVTLGMGMATGEDGNTTPGQTDTTPDAQSNLTVDFGIFLPAKLGNLAWLDTNHNGVADAGEPGLNGVSVILYDSLGNIVARQVTRPNPVGGAPGFYEFTNVVPGQYRVVFQAPGYISTSPGPVSITNGTGPDTNNSQLPGGQVFGSTQVVTLAAGDNNPQLDAGFVNPPVVPTLNEWMLLLLGLLLVAGAMVSLRRPTHTAA